MNNKLTIDKLKQLGARYEIHHFRWSKKKNALLPMLYFRLNNCQSDIVAKGGMTTAFVRFPNGKKYHGESNCMQIDAFKNSLGTAIALERVKEKMDIDYAASEIENP
jgi:hypothetical protein